MLVLDKCSYGTGLSACISFCGFPFFWKGMSGTLFGLKAVYMAVASLFWIAVCWQQCYLHLSRIFELDALFSRSGVERSFLDAIIAVLSCLSSSREKLQTVL